MPRQVKIIATTMGEKLCDTSVNTYYYVLIMIMLVYYFALPGVRLVHKTLHDIFGTRSTPIG